MVFKVLSAREIESTYKTTRSSSVSDMPEWTSLVEALQKGLKKSDGAVIEVKPDSKSEKDQGKAKALQGNLKRNAKKFVKKHALPYGVRAMRDGATGNFIVIVENNKR